MEGPPQLVRHDDAAAFRAAVETFLLQDEPAHNLLLGVLGTLVEHPHLYDDAFLATVESGGAPVAILLRTPPYHALVSNLDAQHAASLETVADTIAAALRDSGRQVTGVNANVPMAAAVAAAWTRLTGEPARREGVQGVFACAQVAAPDSVEGSLRPAGAADQQLVAAWYAAFADELSMDAPPSLVRRQIDARLRGEGGGVNLWEAEGTPLSLAAFGSYTPGGARIGPVYTPPQHRRRGYAGALVAATTQRLLGSGRHFCFLNTDLANPTSNHIYQEIGYRRVATSELWRFAQGTY